MPNKSIKVFKKRYAELAKIIYTNKTHTVIKGDTLSRISRLYNVSIKSIKVLNNLKSDLIRIGANLKLPIKSTSENLSQVTIGNKDYKIHDKTITYRHIVKRYDNWYKIAKFYNVNLKSLLKWNNATKKTTLKVSQKLKIIMKTPVLSKSDGVKLRYVVNTGDTVNLISTGFSISREDLLNSNKLSNSRYLTAGKNLIIMK